MVDLQQETYEAFERERLMALPRNTLQYAGAENKIAEQHEAYNDKATVEAVVLVDRVHYDSGKQWAFQGETVQLTPADAALLEKHGQVKLAAKK